jgi:hypothetical protein
VHRLAFGVLLQDVDFATTVNIKKAAEHKRGGFFSM